MTDDREEGEGARRLAAMRLRPEPPRVMRLSRKVLAGGTGVGLAVVLGAALWALQGERSRKVSPEELHTTDHHNVADGIAGIGARAESRAADIHRVGAMNDRFHAEIGVFCRGEQFECVSFGHQVDRG